MTPLCAWPSEERRHLIGVFTDIDDTLTTCGAITPDALQALGELKAAGLHVVPITGRPIGWCEPFAHGQTSQGIQAWPVDAIVAENGALAVFLDKNDLQCLSDKHDALSKIYQQDARWIVRELWGRDLDAELDQWAYVGDSTNDQVMFEHFRHSIGVANIRRFEATLSNQPRYITSGERGAGFAQVGRAILQARQA